MGNNPNNKIMANNKDISKEECSNNHNMEEDNLECSIKVIN